LTLGLGAVGLSTFIECVLFSESAGGSCVDPWTAGYRSPATSAFVWRVTSSGPDLAMTYTNWLAEPDLSGTVCVFLMGFYSYEWVDYHCSNPLCSVCELDL